MDQGGADMALRASAYAGAIPAGAAATQPDADQVSTGIIIIREKDEDQQGNGYALTAVRTTDGKPLWSTAGDQPNAIPSMYPDLSFFRSPVVAGRYVYDMAVNIGAQMGGVSVVALDVATGKMVWRTPVGSLSPDSGSVVNNNGFFGRGGRGGRSGQVQLLRELSFNSSIAVCGRRLVLTPDLGVAMCLDRFDGRLDWEEPTAPPQVAQPARGGVAIMRINNGNLVTQQRFDATAHVCGDVVVIAPQDSTVVRGLSAADGHMLWQNTDMPGDTLIGGDATRAIFAGTTITALEGASGKMLWTAADKLGEGVRAITGPSIVAGDQVQAPVSGDVIALSVATGEVVKADPSVPRMTPWLKNDATLERLKEDKSAAGFGTHAAVDAPPPPDIVPGPNIFVPPDPQPDRPPILP